MFPRRFFGLRYFAARFWPKVGADPVIPVNTAIFTTGIFKAAQTTGDLTTGFTDGIVTAGQTTGRFK